MVDIEKQIAYWRDSATEDWQVARDLVKQGRPRHGLFFVHLSIEKLLKAHVCKHTLDLAPRIHNLLSFADTAGLEPDQQQRSILAEINSFNLQGRYPDLAPMPTTREAARYIKRATEIHAWLMKQLSQ